MAVFAFQVPWLRGLRVCVLRLSSTSLSRKLTEVQAMSSQPSFFASLFDFSFSRFVTIRLVKFLYVISIPV